ncbi:MAG: radical SAM protein [Methanoregula sp.]
MDVSQNGKVLFIIHDLYQDDNYFPSGVGYLAAVLKKNGSSVEIYSQDVFHYSNEELASFLRENRFDLIGLGFLAARFKETILDLCNVINKNKKSAWLVLGGQGPSPIPEFVLNRTKADIVAIGEAEETIVDLLKCKLETGDLSKIKGIAYRDRDHIFINERRKPIRNLDSIPFPQWDLFPMEEYSSCLNFYSMDKNDKALDIITSRGCINACNFCYRMEKGFRFRSVKNVIQEIIELNEKYGISYFSMHDELFTYPKKKIFEFADALERNDIKIKYDCQVRVDTFDDEVAACLKSSGCQMANFGFESMDQNVLDLMKKNTKVEDNTNAMNTALKYHLGAGLNFIWGNIGDTEESLKKDVSFIKKFNTYNHLRTIRPVTPFPGSELYNDAISRGLLSGPDDFFEKFKNSDLMTVNFTEIPDETFYQLLFNANRDLILDHYSHTSGDMNQAKVIIDDFYNLYFLGKTKFRGARHYIKKG